MYYHDTTTPKQIKALKVAKAAEMKQHTDAMKLVTAKFGKALELVKKLRRFELELSNMMHQGRLDGKQLAEAQKILIKNRRKVAKEIDKILPVK